jgi:ribosomal protein S27E
MSEAEMMQTKTQNLNPIKCQFCGVVIVYANCTRLAFPIGDYMSFVEFKRASYIEVQCGKCAEKTIVRNPQVRR